MDALTPVAETTPLAAPGLGLVLPATAETTCRSDSLSSGPPKNILHVINGEHYSGAERVQDLLAAGLLGHGYAVSFACVKADRFPSARKFREAPLVPLAPAGRFARRTTQQLVGLIEAENFALVHAHTPRTALVASQAARQTGIPFVYHVHSPVSRDSTRVWQDWLKARIERWSLRQASRLIAVSPSLRDYMIDHGHAPQTVVYVPNGVPAVEHAQPRAAPSNGLWTLGMVALFRPRKGLEVLLEAIATLRAAGHNVRLRAIGPFETQQYESAMMCLVERLGLGDAIDWVGFTQSVERELERVQLLVLPSLFGEGLPMVVLEAMAAGLPVVASRVEGVPEAVQHGVNGVLVEPRSAQQLAQGIARIVAGEFAYSAFSQQSIVLHRARFSDERMAAAVAMQYDSLLS